MEEWTIEDVRNWLLLRKFPVKYCTFLCDQHLIDGKALLALSESDLKEMGVSIIGDLKRISLAIDELRKEQMRLTFTNLAVTNNSFCCEEMVDAVDRRLLNQSPPAIQCDFKPEIGKAFIAFLYLFISCLVTSVVMVFAHDRVPNGRDYPPLPDLILENVPYVSWAFEGAEMCAIVLFAIWSVVFLVHKHRFILLRRHCALGGSIFLLRSVTMLITTLSIPGKHINCNVDAIAHTADFYGKVKRGFHIWSGFGMQLQGVRTCGDYMFSGHTVALTLLTFCISEYTPRSWHALHNFTNLLNIFGIFFILAGHEHYSIDVFVAYYISSRMFLYYHSMANSRVLMQPDDLHRTKTWFPLFSYFEAHCFGVVPNEYEWPWVTWRHSSSQEKLNSHLVNGNHYATDKNGHSSTANKCQHQPKFTPHLSSSVSGRKTD